MAEHKHKATTMVFRIKQHKQSAAEQQQQQHAEKHSESRKGQEANTKFNKKVLMHDLGELGFIPAPLSGTAPWLRGKEYKVGILTKQGGIIKTWHQRCFVLREQGLYYFQSKAEYHREAPPFGQILFEDVVCPMRDNPVSEVPTQLLAKRIRHQFGFCVYTAMRTYVLAAEMPEYKNEWMKAIRYAYKQWMITSEPESSSSSSAVSSDMRSTIHESRGESFSGNVIERPSRKQQQNGASTRNNQIADAAATSPAKSGREHSRKPRLVPRESRVWSEALDINGMPNIRNEAEHKRFVRDLREDFESEVLELRKKYELQMLWCRWRAYAKLRARRKTDSLTIM